MENASKALLVAAAVLIAIFLISLAIMIVNSNSGITDQANSTLASAEVSSFNNQFSLYFSNSTSGTAAKSLTSAILQNNSTIKSKKFSPDDHHIYLNLYPKGESKITHKWKAADLRKINNKISNTAKYKITATKCVSYPGGYYNGYLICISITEL